MTNHWNDLQNSDVILIMGANPASNHPVSFRWVMKAKDRGAKVISVDPRFTTSSAKSDMYARLRSGTDIAFLAGMIKYVLEKEAYHKDYVVNYTNAAFLVNEGFTFDEKDGVFSGYDPKTRKYDKGTWSYQLHTYNPATDDPQPDADGNIDPEAAAEAARKKALADAREPRKDPTLKNPRTVFQLLKKHVARYDMKTVSGITGTPVEDLEKVYAMYASSGQPTKAGTIMYAMGWTQHTVGTQNIRTMAMLQLLLGNIGRAGGGVNALRGESNVQGSTDHCLLFHILPGYLKTPKASQPTLKAYNDKYTPKAMGKQSANWWGNYPKYSTSFLTSMFGDKATKANDFGYSWMPKLDDGVNYSWLTLFDAMYNETIKGFFAWGMNPACSGANANKNRKAMAKLDWMVNVNVFPSETGWFWQDPTLGIKPEDIKTEVFVLPAAASVEKEGSVTNSGRWMQWRYQAADRPGDAIPDADMLDRIYVELKKLYVADKGKLPEPIVNLKWDYFHEHEVDPHKVAKEINGYFLKDVTVKGKKFKKGQLVPSFAFLTDDGATSSGNWLYCNSYTEGGNMAARRERETEGIGLNAKWSWCWPVNRRILYNRASVDLNGNPFDPEHPVIAWKDGKWVGDVPDGGWPPMAVNPAATKHPFIMKPEGHGLLFSSSLADGPFPEHYEPLETPLTENPMSKTMLNPTTKRFDGEADPKAAPGSAEYPLVASTYRVTEHWQTGVMTRHAPWLLEAAPQLFVEMSEELAKERNISAGEKVKVTSARGEVLAVAMPTKRFKPMEIEGKQVHQVGLPWCYGWKMPEDGSGGDSANLLTPNIGDPNTMIPETKAFMVQIEKVGGAARTARSLVGERRPS
jgi:formate dehydrogenase major subunit